MAKYTIRPLRIFISYAHKDIAPVRKLYKSLRGKGFDIWLDEKNLVPGQEWQIEIEKALFNSDIAIICLSTDSVERESFIQREFRFALEKALEMPEDRIFLIPVRLDECKVPYKLGRFQWVDLFDQEGYRKLFKALQARSNQLGLDKTTKGPKNRLPSGKVQPNRQRNVVQKNLSDENIQSNQNQIIQIAQTRYLDCLDSARFSSRVSYHNIRLLRLLYVKAQFVLAIISGDIVVTTENQILDSMGFLETFDEVRKMAQRIETKSLPVRAALRSSNTDIHQSVAKNLEKEPKNYTLSLWEDLNTDSERRRRWAHAIEAHKKPSGKDVVFRSEKYLLNKLWAALEYFNAGHCIPAKDVPEEFANRLEQIIMFSDSALEDMRKQIFYEKLSIPKQGVFTSAEETKAAKTIVKILRSIRYRVNRRITSRTIIREAVDELDYDQDIKDGIYELVDGIYNQVLGLASSANIVQSSTFQEQSQPYIKAGYALAAFIQETNNSHFHNMYVPWEIFEYDGLEGEDKATKEGLEIIVNNVPWRKLLSLSQDELWRKSLIEYKSILASLQKIDELLATEDHISSKDLLDQHNTKQIELRKAWSRHINNTRKLVGNSYWGLTESRIFFFSSNDKSDSKSQLPFFISYNHFTTKRDITKDGMYAKWQRNLSLKGRMDARSSSVLVD